MGYVLDAARRRRRRGGRDDHREPEASSIGIEFRVDHVNNQPKIVHTTAASPVEVGTRITVHWPRRRSAAGICGGSVQGASSGPMRGSIRISSCAGTGSATSSSMRKRPIPTGKSGGRATRPSPTGTMKPACSAISPPMWPRPRPRTAPHGARIHRRVPRALRHRRSAQDSDRGRLLAPIARELLRRRPGQSRRRGQALGGDEAGTASRSTPPVSALSAPTISSSDSWRRAAIPTPSSINAAKA